MELSVEPSFYTFKQLAADVLGASQEPMTADEIWAAAETRGLHQKLRKIGKSPAATIYSDLHRATLDDESDFVRVGSRPRRYWLKKRSNADGSQLLVPPPQPETQESQSAPPPAKPAYSIVERDLHPLLAYFADRKLNGLFVKTIFHERSKRKQYGEWVHPDLVGVLFPKRALDSNLAVRLSTSLSEPLCRIYSFELKLKLDFSNLRESFFQALSNSSWAHEGYLVAAAIETSPEFTDELERLSSAFGIGVVELLVDDPESSEIKIPARRRPELDWTTVDKLAEMNPDFASFIKNVIDDLATDIHDKEYDPIPSDPLRYIEDLKATRLSGGPGRTTSG